MTTVQAIARPQRKRERWRAPTASSLKESPAITGVVVRVIRLFFFSSRRRHTRSLRDWSSDVCSSDLDALRDHQARCRAVVGEAEKRRRDGLAETTEERCIRGVERRRRARRDDEVVQQIRERLARSEERRVGKECRSRWSPDHEKKKQR